MSVAELLQAALHQRGMSINELAEATGKSRSWTWGIVNGEKSRRLSSAETIETFAAVLGVEPYDLYAAARVLPPAIEARIFASGHMLHKAEWGMDAPPAPVLVAKEDAA